MHIRSRLGYPHPPWSRPHSLVKTQSTSSPLPCSTCIIPTRVSHSWGRILAATGSIPLSRPVDPTKVCVSFVPSDGTAPLPLLVFGEPEKVDEERATQIVSQEDLEIRVDLGLGKESAKYWTCDFSYVSVFLTWKGVW